MTIPYRLSILYLFFNGIHAWITWDIPFFSQYLIISLICALYQNENKIYIKLNNRELLAFLILFVAYVYVGRSAWKTYALRAVFQIYPLLVLYKDRWLAETIQFVVKWFAILLIPSLIIYAISLVVKLPPVSTISNEASESYVYENYIFYIKSTANFDSYRFNAFSLEAGYLGTSCAFLLYLLKYDFKPFYSKVILISLVLSFSLAGILIAILGYFILNIQNRRTVVRVFTGIVVLSAGVLFFQNYRNGDNIVNELIISRLEIDKDKGIKGNNRFSETADKYYDKLLRNGLIWTGFGGEYISKVNHGATGKGNFQDQIRGAGYKIFILYNGVIGALLCLLYYWFFIPQYPKQMKKYMIGFFALIFITSIQATYPFSYSWLIPYLCGSRIRIDHI